MTRKTKITLYRVKYESIDGTAYGPWETVKKNTKINSGCETVIVKFIEPTPKLADKVNKARQ